MEKQIYIGIDVSSATLDICVRQEQAQQSFVISNQVKAIQLFLRKYTKQKLVIAMENTGRYNWMLYEALAETKHLVYVISPLHLKKSMGLSRGKNDKVDAIRIAAFIEKNYAELKPWICSTVSIQKIKILLTERSCRVRTRRQFLTQQKDYGKMKKLGLNRALLKMNEQLIAKIENQISQIEEQIEQAIQADPTLKDQSTLMKTIPGVGKVLCWMMLAKTEGFTTINDPRKMACYSGVVPFDFQSGTSIKGRQRISVFADKSMKSTLHLAAMSAIRFENDLKQYYCRKVAEGKNKMSVLNAVRNKIVHRIFAVVKSQMPYKLSLELS
jgi:transposase